MFTSSCENNQEFLDEHGEHNENFLSVGEFYKKYIILGKTNLSEFLQCKKYDKAEKQARFRPYIVFFNEPTNCTFAVPMSTSYSFEKNPNNKSFYEIEEEIYKYIYTNVKKPERAVVETTRAFPIAANMAIFKETSYSKYPTSEGLDRYIKFNFTQNEFFKKQLEKPVTKYFTTENNESLYYTSANMGMFLLNLIYQKANIAIELAAKYTTPSGISQLQQAKPIIAELSQNAEFLEQLLYNYFRAKTQHDSEPQKAETLNDLYEICKKITEIAPKIQDNFVSLGMGNLSDFAYNLEFSNEFASCSLNSKRSSFANAIATLESSKNILDSAISQINERERAKQQIIKSNEKEHKEKLQKSIEQEQRKKQSENDKKAYLAGRFYQAKDSVCDWLKMCRENNIDDISKLVDLRENLVASMQQTENNLLFFAATHDNSFINKITSRIIEISPEIKSEGEMIINQYKEAINQIENCDFDMLYSIRQISKKRKIEQGDFSEEQIDYILNSLMQTTSDLIEAKSNFEFITNYTDSILPFINSGLEDKLANLLELSEDLESLQCKKFDFTQSIFGEKANEIDQKIYSINNEINEILQFNNKQELLSNIDNIEQKIRKTKEYETNVISKLEELEKCKNDIKILENEVEKLKNLSEDELVEFIEEGAEIAFSNPKDITYNEINAKYSPKLAFERKLIRSATKLLPKFSNKNLDYSSIENLMRSYEFSAATRRAALVRILALPQAFAIFESDLIRLASGINKQIDNLNLSNGSIISDDLITAIVHAYKNEKTFDEIEFELKKEIYSRIEEENCKPLSLPKLNSERAKTIAKSMPKFIVEPKRCGEAYISVYDVILSIYSPYLLSALTNTTDPNLNAKDFIDGKYEIAEPKDSDYSQIADFFDAQDSLYELCQAYADLYSKPKTNDYFRWIANSIKTSKEFQTKIYEIVKKSVQGTDFENCINLYDKYKDCCDLVNNQPKKKQSILNEKLEQMESLIAHSILLAKTTENPQDS